MIDAGGGGSCGQSATTASGGPDTDVQAASGIQISQSTRILSFGMLKFLLILMVDFGEFFFLLAFSREDFALGIYPRLRGGFIELAALLGKTQRLTRDDALVVSRVRRWPSHRPAVKSAADESNMAVVFPGSTFMIYPCLKKATAWMVSGARSVQCARRAQASRMTSTFQAMAVIGTTTNAPHANFRNCGLRSMSSNILTTSRFTRV